MTDSLDQQEHAGSPHERTVAALARALAATATATGDQTWSAQPAPAAGATSQVANPISVALGLTGAVTGTLVLRVSATEAQLLFPSAPAPDLAVKWQQLGSSVAEQMTRALTQSLGATTATVLSTSAVDLSHPLAAFVLRANDEFTSVPVQCLADAALAESLQAAGRPAANTVRSPSGHRVAPMDRVADVPLAVTIRFGQRNLLLRELLDLTTGSLLELDRQVEEPVDLMLGERVIARGEVVIVDGNYGMRITEVLENATRSTASRERPQPLSYASA